MKKSRASLSLSQHAVSRMNVYHESIRELCLSLVSKQKEKHKEKDMHFHFLKSSVHQKTKTFMGERNASQLAIQASTWKR